MLSAGSGSRTGAIRRNLKAGSFHGEPALFFSSFAKIIKSRGTVL